MSTLRYGILGSGFMGRTHAEAIRHIDDAELVAVAGGSRAPQLAADYGVALCATDEELIARDDVDAVIIATPQFAHAHQALAAAERGKHLFIEKPMTTTVADADAIIDACARRGLALSVGYQQRYRAVPQATRAAGAGRRDRPGAHDPVLTGLPDVRRPGLRRRLVLVVEPGQRRPHPGRRRPRDRPVPLDARRRGRDGLRPRAHRSASRTSRRTRRWAC